MSRKGLAIYVAVIASYEALLSAAYTWLPNGPPVILDPRLYVNWIFARLLDRIPHPIVFVLLMSSLWHVLASAGLLRSPAMVSVFALVETLLSIPACILFGSAVLGFTGHGFTGGVVALGLLVFTACTLVPMIGAYQLMLRGRASAI